MQEKNSQRMFQGVVVSDRMQKTIVVKVERLVMHPKYKKRYHVSERYKVHDEKNEYHVGDVVTFCETRPLSREKRWRVLERKEKTI